MNKAEMVRKKLVFYSKRSLFHMKICLISFLVAIGWAVLAFILIDISITLFFFVSV